MNAQLQPLEPRHLFAAGDPLDSFGTHGQTFTPYELYEARLGQLAVTPGGKLLASVENQYFRDTRPGVAADFVRFNLDGSPDLTFGGAGYVDSFFTTVRRVNVRSDGRFYALGSTRDPKAPSNYKGNSNAILGKAEWFVARFRADGRLDRSFGTRGRVALQLEPTLAETDNVFTANVSSFLDTDGRVTLLADYRSNPRKRDVEPAVFRYDATGRPDPTFNAGRRLDLNSASDLWSEAAITVGTRGDVLVAANRTVRRRETAVVKRFNADGSTDTAFGTGGLVTVSNATGSAAAAAFAPDGGVFAAGNYSTFDGGYTPDRAVLKFDARGAPDPAFGGGRLKLPDSGGVSPLLPLSDGGVVVGGYGSMQRVHADGTFDAAFGRVDAGSDLSVVASDTIYGLRYSSQIQYNRRHQRVDRFGITAISLGGGGGASPVTVSNGRLTLTGTGDDDTLEVTANVDVEDGPVTGVTAYRGFYSRTVPIARVSSVVVNGVGGDDGLVATFEFARGLPVTLNGGTGDDRLAGYGTNIVARGGTGDDVVNGGLIVDSDTDE